MYRYFILPGILTVVLAAAPLRSAEEPPRGSPEAKASRAQLDLTGTCFEHFWNISEVVLNKHIEPPSRQEMFLGGVRGLFARAGTQPPADLSQRVSELVTKEQFAAFLKENWPQASGEAPAAPEQVQDTFVRGVLDRVPGQSGEGRFGRHLITAAEAKVMEAVAGNRYVGVGIQIRMDPKEQRTQIAVPLAGGPARKAGARPGDLILEVDGVSTQGVALSEVVNRIRGDEGTAVSLTVRQPGEKEERVLKMTRSPVPFQTVVGFRRLSEESWQFQVNPDEPIAYVRLADLLPSTPFELRKLERTLLDGGIKALVLDLRSTGSGELHSAALTADALLDGGLMWRVRDKEGHVKEYRADRDCLFRDCRLVVLVNQQTLTAAEFVAAALQDNGRAVVVGEPTRGDGYVNSLVYLPNEQGALVLRTGKAGRASSAKDAPKSRTDVWRPVQPDHVIGLTRAQYAPILEWQQAQLSPEPRPDTAKNLPEDPQLAKALDILRAALQK
jgi:carboxyl-terminal processing protease